MNPEFSFIVLTYNEEVHLPRLLASIAPLGAAVFVLDSGSTDATPAIATRSGAVLMQHDFENHPKQWDFALKNFPVKTPWVICLDADQQVSPGLLAQLRDFRDAGYAGINGIYFNRKNIFKQTWIRFGGYYPFYMLKMFRFGSGFSDLNENMDHRFIVPGKTQIWKNGHIIEENLKERALSFWISKHRRYAALLAQEEWERMKHLRMQTVQPRMFGNPDERTALFKKWWWKMPLFIRPFIYFFYRMFIRFGFLDGPTGILFHFMHSFWFRFLIDRKIYRLKRQAQHASA